MQSWGLLLTEAATSEPVTLSEAKAHLRVDETADDAVIGAMISAARQMAENYTQRSIAEQSWTLSLDGFPADAIVLPRPPAASVEKILYVDPDNNSLELADTVYEVITAVEPGLVILKPSQSWPATRDCPAAVQVEYTAGYAAVPVAVKHAILLLIGHLYAFREPVIAGATVVPVPMAVEALLAPYRVGWRW
jgi:uncharacterized phiE125 gp8 family phage protein